MVRKFHSLWHLELLIQTIGPPYSEHQERHSPESSSNLSPLPSAPNLPCFQLREANWSQTSRDLEKNIIIFSRKLPIFWIKYEANVMLPNCMKYVLGHFYILARSIACVSYALAQCVAIQKNPALVRWTFISWNIISKKYFESCMIYQAADAIV